MTGRTHDLAAFTALTTIVAFYPLAHVSLATMLVSIGANLVGGITPDIDQPTAYIWHRVPAGSLFGKIVQPMLGGHRFISHSILGVFLFGFVTKYLLGLLHRVLLVDMHYVWLAFMIGFISHLIMDTFTREGVPWLFPIPFHFGIPPFRFMRMKTGGVVERAFVFPMLLIFNVYIFSTQYHKFVDFLKHYIKM